MKKYDSYKNSGIEWIGEIPSHWEVKKIKYLASINDDSLSDKTDEEFELDYVDISSIESGVGITKSEVFKFKDAPSRARRIVKHGDVIISTVRTYLKAIAKIDKPKPNLIVSTGFAVLRPKDISPEYSGYLFYHENLLGEIVSRSVGVSYPAINSSEIGTIKIPLPKKTEQTAIATYLDRKTAEIDALITDKKRLLELYEEEKTALINQAVTKGIDPDVPMKDSSIDWLGEIPAHWEVKRVKHVLKSLNSIRVPLSADERGKMVVREYDYYGASGVIDKVEDYLFDEPLLLIGEDGANLLTRNTRLSFIARGKFWVNNHAHILKPKFGLLEYYCELMELCDYSVWISGSAQPKLTSENLMNIQIIVPPIEEQEEIMNFLETESALIDAKKAKTEKLIDLLIEYRTALISEVVTGKVKVID